MEDVREVLRFGEIKNHKPFNRNRNNQIEPKFTLESYINGEGLLRVVFTLPHPEYSFSDDKKKLVLLTSFWKGKKDDCF